LHGGWACSQELEVCTAGALDTINLETSLAEFWPLGVCLGQLEGETPETWQDMADKSIDVC